MEADILEGLIKYMETKESRMMQWLSEGNAQDLVQYKETCAGIAMLKDVRSEIKDLEQKLLEK